MPEDKLMMLWIAIGAAAVLGIVLFWLLLYAVVRAAFLSALRTHAREQRRHLLRTGALDVVTAQTGAVAAAPQYTQGTPVATQGTPLTQASPVGQVTGPSTADHREPAPATHP